MPKRKGMVYQTPSLLPCYICDNLEILYEEYKIGKQTCDICLGIRAHSPVLFDFFVKIIEKKIDKKIDDHVEYWTHGHDYND